MHRKQAARAYCKNFLQIVEVRAGAKGNKRLSVTFILRLDSGREDNHTYQRGLVGCMPHT